MPTSKTFADYKATAHLWLTLAETNYYPDYLPEAVAYFTPILVHFGILIKTSESSETLFRTIVTLKGDSLRLQLLRVFRRYVAPNANVENTAVKSRMETMIELLKDKMRPIQEVQQAFESRPEQDEAMAALLWESRGRGSSGYKLAEKLFHLINTGLPGVTISGSIKSSKDIRAIELLSDYPNPKRKVDFVITDSDGLTLLALGYAHYDSDRGGGQEDDRTQNYENFVNEMMRYNQGLTRKIKAVFINDGPGLLAGSMWDDYASLEAADYENVRVMTLRMIPERLTLSWLRSETPEE